MLIQNASIVFPDRVEANLCVRIRGSKIERISNLQPEIGESLIDATGCYLAPGFIELHMHVGYMGLSLDEELVQCSANQPACGTTGYLVTPPADKSFTCDGVGRDAAGGLSGSVLTQDRAVRTFMKLAGADLSHAVFAASLGPARVLGIGHQVGSIEAGKNADLVLLDHELCPVLTMVAGKTVHDYRSRRRI